MAATIKGITVQIGSDTTGLQAALSDVNKHARDIQSELRQVERLLKFNPHDTELLAQKQQLLADQVENTRKKLDTLKIAQEQVNEQFRKGEISQEQHRAFQRELVKTESQLKDYEKQLKQVNLQNHEFNQRMQELGGKLQDVGERLAGVGKDLSLKLTAPLTALGAVAAKSAIDFESAFASVRKTVDATEDEFAALAEGIRELAKEIPAAATEIAGVAEAAGQLGIANEHILSFTRTMIDLGEATNMSADEAATALARLANITQMPQSEFDRLGSTIVALGNNLATTEAEIVNMGLRLAGAGKQVGMTEAQILSLAGALSSVGIEAEAGGSAISRLLVNMQLAVETGSDALLDFASVAGMTAEGFQQSFQEDAAGALIAFIQGLQTAEERGMSAIKVLDDMGITEIRLRDALLRAAGAGDLFAESIQLGTQAWEENTALTDEAAQRYETTASKLAIMRNRLQDVAITFGEILLPPLVAVAEKVGEFADWLAGLDPKIQQLIVTTGALVTALGPALLVTGQIINALSKIIGLMTVANLKIAAVVAAVAALGAVAYEAYRQWEHTKAYYVDAFEYIRAGVENAVLKIQVAFLELKHIVASFYEDVYSLFGFLEHLPFGLGDSFASYRQWISDVAAETGQSIGDLRQRIEENSARMSQAVDGMREAQSQALEGIMADLQALSDFFKSDSDVRITITETSEKEQTAIVTQQAQERLNVLTESEERQTQVVTEEEQKRIEARTKFEAEWNRKLFQLTADRLAQLEAEEAEALARAEALEADKTAILEYYSIKRQEILNAEIEREREAEQRRLDALAKFEEDWARKLFEATADRLEILEREKQEALAKAEELGAETTAIIQYYALQRQRILDEEAEAEERRHEQRQAALAQFEESWTQKLFQATAGRLEILEREKEDALAKAEELGADKTAIIEYYALQQQRILDEQARATQEAAEREAQALAAFEEAWTRKLFEQSATRLELLQRDRDEAIRKAEEIGADTTAIREYYANEERRILDELEAERDAARERELKAEQDAQRERERLLRQWEKRLFEQTASELEILEARMQEELRLAEEHGLETLAILEYYENERQKILERQRAAEEQAAEEAAKREAEALEARERARLEFEERWARRLFELQADELERLEREKEEAVRQAEEIGADTTAVLEYYAEKELEIRQRRAEEAQKIAEAEAEAERKRIEELEQARLEFEQSWEDRLFRLTASREELLLREREQALAKAAELGADVNKILEYYARRQAELAEEIANEQKTAWEKAFESIESPLDRFVSAVSDAAGSLVRVARDIRTGDWRSAVLSILTETQSFAKAMELIGAVMQPVVVLFDAVLKPIINGLLNLWNGIMDALASISIFGWKPFAGLKDKKIGLVGDGEGAGGGRTERSGGGGRQVSEITGPTRDLLTDLLSPLAHLGSIVAPIQDIRQILYERLPNFNQMEFAGAGVGAMGPAVIIENLNVNAPTTGVDDISRATIDQIEKALAGRINFDIRGRGGR